MVVGGPRLEVRYPARSPRWKERRRLYRRRYHGKARGPRAGGGEARGRRVLPERRRGDRKSLLPDAILDATTDNNSRFSRAQIGSDEEEIRDAAQQISEKKALLKKLSQSKNTLKNRPVLPRKTQHVSLKQFTTGMRQIGLDPKHLEKRAEVLVAKEKEAYEAFQAENGGDAEDGMDVDGEAGPSISGKTGRSRAIAERRAPRTDRRYSGMTTSTVCRERDFRLISNRTKLISSVDFPAKLQGC